MQPRKEMVEELRIDQTKEILEQYTIGENSHLSITKLKERAELSLQSKLMNIISSCKRYSEGVEALLLTQLL
tara:strand:+ start:700 stop:915 length:216 start_codon:yes stop_codon:yes gene_type:complete